MALIRELDLNDIDKLIEHLQRHFKEPGVNGIIAQPFSESEPFDPVKYRARAERRWALSPGVGNWEKMWILIDNGQIVGHTELAGNSEAVLSHRARLGIGIESKYRGAGFGKQLMASALAWAGNQAFLSWVDLDVFSHNTAAINLYKQFGFTVVGHTPDRLRVAGHRIDDLHMVLSLSQDPDIPVKSISVEPYNIADLEYQEMNTKTEKLSHSAILTEKTDFQKLFVHHEVIPPGRRTSRPHYHSHTEEMFLVMEGQATISYGDRTFQSNPGDFIAFPPGDRQLHCIYNHTDKPVKVLGICADHPLDQTFYDVKKP